MIDGKLNVVCKRRDLFRVASQAQGWKLKVKASMNLLGKISIVKLRDMPSSISHSRSTQHYYHLALFESNSKYDGDCSAQSDYQPSMLKNLLLSWYILHANTLQNGVGSFILQCKKLDFHYCDWAGSSKGMKYVVVNLPVHWMPFLRMRSCSPSTACMLP